LARKEVKAAFAKAVEEATNGSSGPSSLLGSLQIRPDNSDSASAYSLKSSPARCTPKTKRNTKDFRMAAKAWFENKNYHELSAATGGKNLELKCVITGHTGFANSVKAAHLLPHCASANEMAKVGLTDINSMKNALPLASNMEIAYEYRRVCIMPVSLASPALLQDKENSRVANVAASCQSTDGVLTTDGALLLKLVILDATVRDEAIYPGSEKTIGEFEGKPFACPYGRTPSTKVLSYHVEKAYERATRKAWISQDEKPQDFGTPLRNNVLSLPPNERSEMQDQVKSAT